jgi:hypothetical protein
MDRYPRTDPEITVKSEYIKSSSIVKTIHFQGVQLKALGSPSTYTSTGSRQFVSAASYFGVLPGQGFELPVCSRCRQPGVETAGEPATADRSNVVSSEVSRSMHRLHDDSAETDPRPGLSRFQMEARFSAIPDTFNCTPWRHLT